MQLSFTRLCLLFKKQWIENQKLYPLAVLAMIGISAAILTYVMLQEGLRKNAQEVLFPMGLFLFNLIFSSTTLSQFNSKNSGIQALTIPASSTEKLIIALLFSLILFPLTYLLTIYPLLILFNYIDGNIIGNLNEPLSLETQHLKLLANLLIQSIAVCCSIVFKRYVFIKTVISTFIIVVFINYLNYAIARGLLANIQPEITPVELRAIKPEPGDSHFYFDDAHLFSSAQFERKGKPLGSVSIENKLQTTISISLLLSGLGFLWILTWFKLKEKQL